MAQGTPSNDFIYPSMDPRRLDQTLRLFGDATLARSSTDLAASRRALPIVTAHALFDLYALLRLW